MSTLRESVRGTTGTRKEYLYIYSVSFLWALSYAVFTPAASVDVLTYSGIIVWTGLTMIAAVVGIAGILKRSNLILERLGVTILMITPLTYAVLQLGIIIYEIRSPEPDTPLMRISVILIGLWLFIPLNYRRRELANRVKEAVNPDTTPIDIFDAGSEEP